MLARETGRHLVCVVDAVASSPGSAEWSLVEVALDSRLPPNEVSETESASPHP
jgi:hypothetical protein